MQLVNGGFFPFLLVEKATCFKRLHNGDLLRSPVVEPHLGSNFHPQILFSPRGFRFHSEHDAIARGTWGLNGTDQYQQFPSKGCFSIGTGNGSRALQVQIDHPWRVLLDISFRLFPASHNPPPTPGAIDEHLLGIYLAAKNP